MIIFSKGINVGKSQCRSPHVQKKVMASVSDTMHKKLIKFMLANPNEPIVLVLDGSEDVSKK